MTLAEILALIAQLPSVVTLIEEIIAAVKAAGGNAAAVQVVRDHVAKLDPSSVKCPDVVTQV